MEKRAAREVTKHISFFLLLIAKPMLQALTVKFGNGFGAAHLRKGKHMMNGFALGFRDPLIVSAEKVLGFGDFYQAIDELHRERTERRLVYKCESGEQSSNPENKMRASFDDELLLGFP